MNVTCPDPCPCTHLVRHLVFRLHLHHSLMGNLPTLLALDLCRPAAVQRIHVHVGRYTESAGAACGRIIGNCMRAASTHRRNKTLCSPLVVRGGSSFKKCARCRCERLAECPECRHLCAHWHRPAFKTLISVDSPPCRSAESVKVAVRVRPFVSLPPRESTTY